MKISIIVPVYNVERYLEKCLESILRQTWQEYELILVDDGSADASGEICDRYAALDTRIKVIHKEHGHVTSARKAGLRNASCEFIGWVDADDWIEEDYFEQMALAAQESGADIIAAHHYRDVGTHSYVMRSGLPDGLYKTEAIIPQLMFSGKSGIPAFSGTLWNKLIRKDILEQTALLLDEKITLGEDGIIVYTSVLNAETIMITSINGYHYVQHPVSITKSLSADDLNILALTFHHLEAVFAEKNVLKDLRFQLLQWKKNWLLSRRIEILDQNAPKNLILFPYGGIAPGSRIVIYGGSEIGKRIQEYVSADQRSEIVLWIDLAYEHFKNMGLPIVPPCDIQTLNGNYDYVLLATDLESTADSMKRCLLELAVPENKIRWLTTAFLEDDTTEWI